MNIDSRYGHNVDIVTSSTDATELVLCCVVYDMNIDSRYGHNVDIVTSSTDATELVLCCVVLYMT